MRYEGVVYRPPSEAESLLIQATIGCPHNKCTFCSMYKGTRFRVRPVEEVLEDLREARRHYGDWVRSLFLPDGNTIILKTADLVRILTCARELFPRLERITVYGSARYVNKKSAEELAALREAGLSRVHMGMESGDDEVLARICKGTTAAEIVEAGRKLKQAGIELSEYYLVGIGGPELSRQHALNSARVLNQIVPDFIRLRTFQPVPGSPLYEEYRRGDFRLLTPHQALAEVRLLVENLECPGTTITSDHVSNYWNVHGVLPRDRQAMLQAIDYALTIPETTLKPREITHL
ncbi:MAG: radical SAM protein [Syntrophomonadaceae bacterium]|jgi:radical SAM superfamily enzyme YgiQ (UPF0313 family)|nr:radical SAM protein [Syntrophomonadaceae bacterium]MDH7497484.1 radical SAM protein [Syntrophomonadaceae bacterium]